MADPIPPLYEQDKAPTLSYEFLNSLVAELDNDDIVGIILGGSYARGEARLYSDVDIACFTLFTPSYLVGYMPPLASSYSRLAP
jgi:predicted nucleotidyltransferase